MCPVCLRRPGLRQSLNIYLQWSRGGVYPLAKFPRGGGRVTTNQPGNGKSRSGRKYDGVRFEERTQSGANCRAADRCTALARRDLSGGDPKTGDRQSCDSAIACSTTAAPSLEIYFSRRPQHFWNRWATTSAPLRRRAAKTSKTVLRVLILLVRNAGDAGKGSVRCSILSLR